MTDQRIDGVYKGIDLSPDIIEQAKALTESIMLYEADFFDFYTAEQSYDWVFLSRALNEPLKDDVGYIEKMTSRICAIYRKGLAFKLLDESHD